MNVLITRLKSFNKRNRFSYNPNLLYFQHKMNTHKLKFAVLVPFLLFMLTSSMYGQRPTLETDIVKMSFRKHLNVFYPVNNGVTHRNYLGKVIKGSIDGLLDGDVMRYYKLYGKYNSPLKQKMFRQSQEYKNLWTRLYTERRYLLVDTFFVVSKIQKTDYNLREKAFYFYQNYGYRSKTSTYYIEFPNLWLFSPLIKREGLKLEIENENIALEVENNYQDCRLVYVFFFKDAGWDIEYPTGIIQKILLVNIKTGKVYYHYERKRNLIQYDHDIYIERENDDAEDRFFLKTGNKMIEIETILDGIYDLDIEGNKYYVNCTDGKRYLLNFKPKIAFEIEKTDAYFAKCDEIAKDYELHPEDYQDVTIVKDGMHYYRDKTGCEWYHQSEVLGCYVLEEEGVYMIFEELKFVKKKTK